MGGVFEDAAVEDYCYDGEEAEGEDLLMDVSMCLSLGSPRVYEEISRLTRQRPPTTIFSPIFSFSAVPPDMRPAPPPWVQKERTSPATKIFVSHLARTSECLSPSTKRIILPKVM